MSVRNVPPSCKLRSHVSSCAEVSQLCSVKAWCGTTVICAKQAPLYYWQKMDVACRVFVLSSQHAGIIQRNAVLFLRNLWAADCNSASPYRNFHCYEYRLRVSIIWNPADVVELHFLGPACFGDNYILIRCWIYWTGVIYQTKLYNRRSENRKCTRIK